MPKYYSQEEVEQAIPEYSFEEHIASGGFKDVFLAKREGEETVVKLIPVNHPSRRDRAHREAEAMQKIESDSFVDLKNFFETEVAGKTTFVIEEEYIGGDTLDQAINSDNYGLDLGMQVGQTLLDLLVELDEKDIIHRDIKPQNMMVDEKGIVRVLDVGIVRFEERESLTPDHLDRLGTPNYGAPEQLNYDKELQSIRTDLFSTGIVIFESITGTHPFSGTGRSISDAIVRGERQSITDYIEDQELAEDLEYFTETLTATEPHRRFRKPDHAKEYFEDISRKV